MAKTCKKCGIPHGQHTPGCPSCYMREVYYKRPGAVEKRRVESAAYYERTKGGPAARARRAQRNSDNLAQVRAIARRSGRAQKARFREMVAAAKRVPCARCGGEYPPVAMDFHHRDPADKMFNVSQMLAGKVPGGTGKSREALLREEIAKCDVLCAVCHRIEHAPGEVDSGHEIPTRG